MSDGLALDAPPAREAASPVVLLHGFLGEPADWDAVVADLAVPRRVARIDLVALAARGAQVDELARAVCDALRAHQLREAKVVGYSLGARVAMSLLELEAHEVIAVSGTPGIDDELERVQRATADTELSAALEREGLGPFLDRWYAQPLFASLRSHPDYAMVARRRLAGDSAVWGRILREASPGRSASLWSRLPMLAPHLQLAVGSLDGKYLELARRARALVPELSVTIIEGAGHAIHLERPQSLAALIDRLP